MALCKTTRDGAASWLRGVRENADGQEMKTPSSQWQSFGVLVCVSDDAAGACATFLSKISTTTVHTRERADSGAGAAPGMETSEVPGRYRASVWAWRYP